MEEAMAKLGIELDGDEFVSEYEKQTESQTEVTKENIITNENEQQTYSGIEEI